IDTFAKGPPRKTLLDWLSADQVRGICQRCHAAEVRVALAGSLGEAEILTLMPAEPDWFAVRGAACAGGRRDARVSPGRVRYLKEMLAAHAALSSDPTGETKHGLRALWERVFNVLKFGK